MNTRFEVQLTPIADLLVLQRKLMGDNRGYLERLFCAEELESFLAVRRIVQVNHTVTRDQGTVRGMHFQYPPHAETKFVCCLQGEVFDVAVDLRSNSPTFLHWHAEILSAENHRTLVIPEGFAHGFQTLTSNCEMLYLHTAAYHAPAESGLNPLDPQLAISWPLPVQTLSPRDASHLMLDEVFAGVAL